LLSPSSVVEYGYVFVPLLLWILFALILINGKSYLSLKKNKKYF